MAIENSEFAAPAAATVAMLARGRTAPVDVITMSVQDVVNRLRPPLTGRIEPLEPALRIEDRTISGPRGGTPVRIYWPLGEAPFGAVINLHGGGWVTGSIESDHRRSHAIAHRAGVVVITVDYALAPEHRFPAALDDSYAAFQWTVQNAASIGVDPGRIGLLGASSGGNLAIGAALMALDRSDVQPALQVLVYPALDPRMAGSSYDENADFFPNKTVMQWFWDQYTPDPADRLGRYVDILRARLQGLPPTFIANAEYDPMRGDGEALVTALRSAGVETDARLYPLTHGFMVGATAAEHPESQRALDEIARYVRARLAHGG
jgi:acetyl esterase